MKKKEKKDKKSPQFLRLKRIDFKDNITIFSYEFIKNGKRV